MQQMTPTQITPEEIAVRRRRARSMALVVAAFALVVYVLSILVFINR
jgi:hypothetical protein